MKNFEKMPIENLEFAGIDTRSKSLFIAVGQNDDEIRVFFLYKLSGR